MTTNGKMILRFEPDPLTEMPHLVDPGGCLTSAVRADWEAELRSRCNDQSLRSGETIAFATRAKNLPSRFLVRAESGASNRMPSYVLEPVEPAPAPADPAPRKAMERGQPVTPSAAPPLSAPLEAEVYWPAGFLMAARRLAREQQADRMGRHGLQFVLEELHDLARDYPREMLVLLVSSYTAIRKLACSGNPELAREEQFYDRALEALDARLLAVAAERHAGTFSALIGAMSRWFGREGST
jgi:hypothetical protein